MKAIKITYWISTILISALFAMSVQMYLSGSPKVVEGFKMLGYPDYLRYILATAKIIGVLILLIPAFPRLKEWAYAGFFIDIVGAFWSHMVMQGIGAATGVILPAVLLAVSYITFRRLQAGGVKLA